MLYVTKDQRPMGVQLSSLAEVHARPAHRAAAQVPHHTDSLLPIDVQRPSCSVEEAACIMTGPETQQFAAWANASGFECVPTALLVEFAAVHAYAATLADLAHRNRISVALPG